MIYIEVLAHLSGEILYASWPIEPGKTLRCLIIDMKESLSQYEWPHELSHRFSSYGICCSMSLKLMKSTRVEISSVLPKNRTQRQRMMKYLDPI